MRRAYYSPVAYSATKLVLDGVLLRALPALLFAVPFYFLMGLSPGAGPFCTFALVFIAFNATVGALALSLAAALDSPGKTVLAMNLVLLVGVLFAGFLANKESIPLPLRWITYLSVFRCGPLRASRPPLCPGGLPALGTGVRFWTPPMPTAALCPSPPASATPTPMNPPRPDPRRPS
jgi:hypothetical protein